MWIILAGLLTARGLLSALEAALQTVSDARARELAALNPRRGGRVLKLKMDPEGTAAALRSGMVLTGFMSAAIGVTLATSADVMWISGLGAAMLVAVVAVLVEVSFRSAAIQKPEAWAMTFSFVALMSGRLLSPVLYLLVIPVNLVLKPFNARVTFQLPAPTLEELQRQLISQAQKQELDQDAPKLIRSVFALTEKTCRDVMVPRTDVVSLDISTPVHKLLELISEENHSRIPVFRDDVDHIIGILHVRDIVPLLQNPELILLQDLMRPAVFVPWMKPVADLQREMQRKRIHMAVVVDEYGGFSGIVTLEDILSEIVGNIGDEFDEEVKAFEKQTDGSFLVDAMLPREDFAKAFEFKFPDGDFETLGGYLSHLSGAIPEVGDRFNSNGFTFVVHSKEGPRLNRVKVLKPPKPPERTVSGSTATSTSTSTSQENLPEVRKPSRDGLVPVN